MEYDFVILPGVAVVLTLFCIANFCKNFYRKQNKKILTATRKICAFPHKTAQFASALPADYQRQWRAYVNSGAQQPSLAFEFVPKRNRTLLARLISVAAIVSSCYIAAFVFDTTRLEYIVFQLAFWLAFSLIMVADRLLFLVRERKAKQIFARLVSELNRNAPTEQTKVENMADTVKQIKELSKCPHTNAVFDRASQLLHSKGLNADRSPEDQRKLNDALNGLLQSYTRNTAN